MTDSRAEDALRIQSTMEAQRSNLDSHCQEVADRVLTRQRDFTTKGRIGGEKLNEKVFDSTAPLALDKFAAAIEGMLTPRTQQWHELRLQGRQQDDSAKQWLSQVNDTLFQARYAPTANFASQAHETYIGLGAFGNGAMFVDEGPDGIGLRYRSIPFAEVFWAENFQGMVDTVHRKFELTARQMAQQFGEDELPESIRKCLEQEPLRKFELIHCVRPREDAKWDRMDYRGMRYASYYVAFEGRKLLKESGYRTMRYATARYVTAPRETYGRGPAMTVLATIKTANEMQKTLLRTGQLASEPPLLVTDDGGITPKLQPRAIIRGGIDQDGRATVQPLQVGANLPINLEMLMQERNTINEAFLVTLFQILVETPQMTATEAMLRAQEKGQLLAPTMGRLQSELLGPIIQAELDILSAQGWFDDLPEDAFSDDGIKIEYTSPLARAQMADEGIGILRTIETSGPIMEIDPDARSVFSGKGADIIRRLGEINGMSPTLLNTKDEIAAISEQMQQRAQTADVLAAAESASGSAANFAKAQSLIGSAPSQMAPEILPA
jgi:hypothetical protein